MSFGGAMNEQNARILAVDDEPSITDFVSYNLQKEGYIVDIATDGDSAVKMASENPYDLVILDVRCQSGTKCSTITTFTCNDLI